MSGTALRTADAGTAGPIEPGTLDTTAIAGSLFAHMDGAWNGADGAGFGEVFTDDATFVDIRGVQHDGVAAIANGHQAILDTIYAGSTVRYDVERSRLVAPGCMVASVAATLDVPSGPASGIRHSRITATIVRQGDGWAVAAFHNTIVQEAP